MKNRFEYIVFILFAWMFQFLGLSVSRRFAGFLAAIFFYFIPIRKKIVIANLKMAFPELSDKKIRSIAFNNYKNFAIILIEIFLLPKFSRADIAGMVKFENGEIVFEKYNQQKGIVLLSAHFGNWEILPNALGLYLNLKINVIVKPLRNPHVDRWMNTARTKWFNEVIPMGVAIRRSYQVLKDKQLLAIAVDQRGPEEGIKIDFFGKQTSVFTGPAVFALKTDAPIIYFVSVRQPDFTYKVTANEIRTDDLIGTEDEKILEISRRHIKLLESYVRQYPDYWLWMHKRWKH